MKKEYYPGIGQAVADRTINRPGEKWENVAARVAHGNTWCDTVDRDNLEDHIGRATILMSGRHLQHGDANQAQRPIEVFSNCSTAMTRTETFYLLLNGSGVGTSYDDDIQVTDWSKMPQVACVLANTHADWSPEWQTREEALNTAQWAGQDVVYFRVPDSREGWAEAVQVLEEHTWRGTYSGYSLIIDFSDVRPFGSPIHGMQGRPSSGPIPLMQALRSVGEIKNKGYALWRQAMEIDHLLAECVLVGGARRAARIAVKAATDPDILEYIRVKSEGGLWSANNSVGVNASFWRLDTPEKRAIYDEIIAQSYGNGEPGFINLDLLQRGETRPSIESIMAVGHRFGLSRHMVSMRHQLAVRLQSKKYWMIVNPCAEIRLSLAGALCIIADLAPVHTHSLEDFKDAALAATRALIRVNKMSAYYHGEVSRTNRIGVGLTGIFEYAMKHYGLSFRDLIEEGDQTGYDANGNLITLPSDRVIPFWMDLASVAQATQDEAVRYSAVMGLPTPATVRTNKPAGSTSKLFGLTEGAHLPSMREYLRWVQFRSDDPLVDVYVMKGYPVRRNLKTYSGTSIVGFPTQLPICTMGPVTTAAEATPQEQIRWLRLLEMYWLLQEGGAQISYTLKYDPRTISMQDFSDFMKTSIPLVRAVSVMPQHDTSAYEYQPEEPITAERYADLMSQIELMAEDADKAHVDCAGGFCPVDFNKSSSVTPVLV